MKIQFLGSGDAFGSGGRFNTCFLVEADTTTFLIDCGASAMISLRRYGIDPNRIQTIFVSHLHGDHFGGLPFLILDAQFYSKRTEPLTLVGPPGFKVRLYAAMELFFPGSSSAARKFTLEIREIAAGQAETINGVGVTPYLVKHDCGSPPFALRLACDDKIVAYTGDTEWTDELLSVGKDADVLIAEALFYERKVKFHLDYASLKDNLARIGAKRIILTHMGPDMLANIHRASHELAEDGKVFQL